MNKVLTYSTIFKDIKNHKTSGTRSGSEFNLLDTPGRKYFKIFFYFNNGDIEGNGIGQNSGGLLAPSWLNMNDENNESQYYDHNSAWTYLKMNYEDDRADMLKQFVNLLSNISTESPWYFSEISGLDSALERKQPSEIDFKIAEESKKITIKCLPDSFDDRIGTLLDLYRSIVWSWVTKREILPANLRKFDMGIFIFNDPVNNFSHYYKDTQNESQTDGVLGKNIDYSYIGYNEDLHHSSSYKYIEFHNCEFDYNSSISSMGSLNNTEGVSMEYNINIQFDDCFEQRFNEYSMRLIGDMVMWDTHIQDTDIIPRKTQQEGKKKDINPLIKTEAPDVKKRPKALTNAINQLTGTAGNIIGGVIKRAVLGNLYTYSLTRIKDQVKSVLEGNVWTGVRNVVEYVDDAKQRKEHQLQTLNIFNKSKKILHTKNEMGNIFRSSTIANNL